MSTPWTLADGGVIDLVTKAEFDALADGTVLTCIDGTTATKGHDFIDDDTRAGYLAFGLPRNDGEGDRA